MKLMTLSSLVPKRGEAKAFPDKDINNRLDDASPVRRLVIAYLPWLSLITRFGQTPGDNQRLSAATTDNLDCMASGTKKDVAPILVSVGLLKV